MSAKISSIDITVILTAHAEGLLAAPAGRSAQAAIALAESAGLRCETVVVLDRADQLTRSVLLEVFGRTARFLETDEGDPGQARNRGTEAAWGTFSTFLDGDDLWSENWLTAAHAQASTRPDAVHQCACIFRFGNNRHLFWHSDSENALCDLSFLDWSNYWDSMSFARTTLYREFPFKPNDLELGFGHEDWHWSAWTIAEGIPHKPVPGTLHFKRSRPGSQMSKVNQIGGLRWPVKKGEFGSTASSTLDHEKVRYARTLLTA